MKRAIKIIVLLAALALAASIWVLDRPAEAAISTLGGHYTLSHHVMIAGADAGDKGETIETADDELTITHDRGDSFDFHTLLMFSYGHTCELTGTAYRTMQSPGGDEFTYKQPDAEVLTKRCMLKLAVDAQHITLLDPENSCSDSCGARGYFDQAQFLRAAKRPAKN